MRLRKSCVAGSAIGLITFLIAMFFSTQLSLWNTENCPVHADLSALSLRVTLGNTPSYVLQYLKLGEKRSFGIYKMYRAKVLDVKTPFPEFRQ